MSHELKTSNITHIEGMILLRVQNLQQSSSRVSMEIDLPNLVNLIPKKKTGGSQINTRMRRIQASQ